MAAPEEQLVKVRPKIQEGPVVTEYGGRDYIFKWGKETEIPIGLADRLLFQESGDEAIIVGKDGKEENAGVPVYLDDPRFEVVE